MPAPVSVTKKMVPHLHPRGTICLKDYFNISHLTAQYSSLSSKAYLTDSNIQCYSPCVHKQTDKLNAPQPVCLYLPCREWEAFRCLADLTPGIRFVCSDPAEASWREQWAPFYLCLSKMSPASRLWAFTLYLLTLKWCIFLFIHEHFWLLFHWSEARKYLGQRKGIMKLWRLNSKQADFQIWHVLKGYFTQKWKFYHHLLTFMLFRHDFLLQDTKEC